MSRRSTKRIVLIVWIVLIADGAYLVVGSQLRRPRAERVAVSPVGRAEPPASNRPAARRRHRPVVRPTPTTSASIVAAPAPAPAPPFPPPPPTPSALCLRAIASVSWPPGWRPACAGSRAGLLGLTSPSGTSQIFMRSQLPAGEYLLIALHEAGNAWNFARLNTSDQVTWCAARGCDAAAFFAGPVHAEGWVEARGAEDWAEAWQACHGVAYDRSYLGLGPPTAALCALQRTLVAS